MLGMERKGRKSPALMLWEATGAHGCKRMQYVLEYKSNISELPNFLKPLPCSRIIALHAHDDPVCWVFSWLLFSRGRWGLERLGSMLEHSRVGRVWPGANPGTLPSHPNSELYAQEEEWSPPHLIYFYLFSNVRAGFFPSTVNFKYHCHRSQRFFT